MAVTTNLQVTKIDSAQAQKEVTANEAFDAFDAGFSQFTKAMSDADYTLLSTTVPKEWQYGILSFTGTLTANRNIIVPTAKKTYVLINGTTGGFSLTLKTAAGTGVAVTGSTPRILRCDGTNIVDLFTVPNLSTITPNAQTGTTYTYVNGDNSKLVSRSNASAMADTLPQAGSGGNFGGGWFMFVQNKGPGTQTITPTISTIDGAASLALTTGQGVLICSDGTNYFSSRGMGSAGSSSPTTTKGDLIVRSTTADSRLAVGANGLSLVADSAQTLGVKWGDPLGWFNVKSYGALGDGATDDTVAIQAALDACETAGGGTVYFPRGVYIVGGALQDTGRSNAQLLLPRRDYADTEAITVVLRGEAPPSAVASVIGVTPLPDNLSVIKGTLNAGAGGALIGAQGPVGTSFLFTNLLLSVRDLAFQMPVNPVLSACNFSKVAQFDADNLLIHAGNFDVTTIAAQTTATSYGLRTPAVDNGAVNRMGVVNVVGFYNGFEVGEHCVGQSVAAWGCMKGYVLPAVNHASMFTRLMTVHCQRGLVFTAADHTIHISEFNVEHAASGTWAPVYDVDDASNFARGALLWHVVLAGTGINNTFLINGAAYLKRGHLYYQGLAYSLTDAVTVTIDCNLSDTFRWTIAGNRTFANPTGPYDGQVINVRIKQDATGGRTWTLGSKFKFPGGAPALSTAASAEDFISCQYDAAVDTWFCSLMKAMA